jgi:hypothetical protein
MNERIKELADICFSLLPNNDELELYTRLIVRECANQLPRISEDYYTGDGIVEDSQKLILEHFGVER